MKDGRHFQAGITRGTAMSDDNESLIGTWKLLSCVMEDVETGNQELAWGERPNGFLVLTPSRRWIVVQTAEQRESPRTDADRSAAFRSMLAYSGTYRTEGDKIVISVDIAWDEAWNGTEQVRSYRLEGDKLHIEAAPQAYPGFGTGIRRAVLVWARDA
jgi:hypothetical protein